MKRPRPATVAGSIAGAILLAVAALTHTGCSAVPPYASIGFHWTTIPTTTPPAAPQPPASSPAAAARP